MDLTNEATFRIHALPAALLDEVRTSGRDVSGSPIVRLRASGDGEPLRCCLRNAHAGEPLILFGYAPPIAVGSPYREVGAVFAHAEPCAGPPPPDAYPPAWRGKPQVLRSYDARGFIHAAVVHDGSEPEAELARLLADPAAVQVHSRNVAYGCFMFVVTRS
jgi:hypothetical protein